MTTKKNIYFDNLCRRVCELSVSSDCFKTASMEWTVTNYFEERNQECCCGKKEICHIYSIANQFNANKIEYIGSKCITLFGNDELNDGMKTAKSIVNENQKRPNSAAVRPNSFFRGEAAFGRVRPNHERKLNTHDVALTNTHVALSHTLCHTNFQCQRPVK